MNRTMLVADDDIHFQGMVTRIFEGTAWTIKAARDGFSAMESMISCPPDLVLLDLNMPLLSGRTILGKMRRNPQLEMIPVIIVSGEDSPQEKAADFSLGADDFISKPFDPLDLRSRVESADKRSRRMLCANPLTRLPGSPSIEEEAWRRIKEGAPMAFFHIDIDNFKAYNDAYGPMRGDDVIKGTARLLLQVQEEFPADDIFLGHIGGDDFVVISSLGREEQIAGLMAERFDRFAREFYGPKDQARGYIVSTNRLGERREFPLMTVSIAVAANDKKKFSHYAEVTGITSDIKRYLKKLPVRTGSVYLKDRRRD